MKRYSLLFLPLALLLAAFSTSDRPLQQPSNGIGQNRETCQSYPCPISSSESFPLNPMSLTNDQTPVVYVDNGRLHKGDHVTIISTARKVTPQKMQASIDLFRSWGLIVDIDPRLYAQEDQMAGSDANRLAMLQDAINNPKIKAIFCARGGYGSVRIIDQVDFSPLKDNPKWIIGFSDVTVLHSHLHTLGFQTIHGIMPISIPAGANRSNNAAIASLYRILFEGTDKIEFSNHEYNRKGSAEAPIVGGNLSILYSLLGSPSDIDTDGKILMIEDLDEYLYHIDRMIMALKRAGKLKNIKALVVGGMTDMHDNEIPFGRNAEQIIRDAVAEYDYPVCFDAPFGHIGSRNRALPLGKKVRLTIENNTKIEILNS